MDFGSVEVFRGLVSTWYTVIAKDRMLKRYTISKRELVMNGKSLFMTSRKVH